MSGSGSFRWARLGDMSGWKWVRVAATTGWRITGFPLLRRAPLPSDLVCAPLALLPEVSLRHCLSWSHRSGSDRGRPMVWHPDPSRHLRAAMSHESFGHPVSVCSFWHSLGSSLRIAGCGKLGSHGRWGSLMPWISSMSLRE